MALTYDEMMFECVLDNVELKTQQTHKKYKSLSKLSLKKSSKSSKKNKYYSYIFDKNKNVDYNELKDIRLPFLILNTFLLIIFIFKIFLYTDLLWIYANCIWYKFFNNI